MKVYLASRYRRRAELCGYREQLKPLGVEVTSRWLDEIEPGIDLNIDMDGGVTATSLKGAARAATIKSQAARVDLEDIDRCDMFIGFAEPDSWARAWTGFGGRHVEFGYALASKKQIVIVGGQETIFHWLPQVTLLHRWEDVLAMFHGYTGLFYAA